MAYKPPYLLTSDLRLKLSEVIRLIGRLEGYQILQGNLKLRRINKIKSLHSSLAIEGNQLSEEQVTAILDGKPVLGSMRDIQEVKNAITVYDELGAIDAYKEDDLLNAHGLLMRGLIDDAGRYRNSGVGVVDGDKVIHIAPPARQVPRLMGDLFEYLTDYEEDHVIKSCVFHYEFEFIHPFSDGNGRMGRLWQTAILKSHYPIMEHVPIETMIYDRQQGYYTALQQSQSVGDSNPFIVFTLGAIERALLQQLESTNVQMSPMDRLMAYYKIVGEAAFTRKAYQQFHKSISPATATRDLKYGVDEKTLTKAGKMATVTYQFT